MTAYPYGYPDNDKRGGAGATLSDYGPGDYRTVEQLDRMWQWSTLNAEFRRRLVALFDHCAANGHPEGLGGGARSTATQRALFISRGGLLGPNDEVIKPVPGTAPPGLSYHEDGTPIVGAVAADLVPAESHGYMNSVAHLFGLAHLRDSSVSEPWHVQPLELPRSRRVFNANPAAYPLQTWVLPGDEKPAPQPTPEPEPEPPTVEEDDPMFIARNHAGQYAVGDSVKKAVYSESDVAFALARAERAGRPLIDEATGQAVTWTAWRANKALVSPVSDSQFRTLGTG